MSSQKDIAEKNLIPAELSADIEWTKGNSAEAVEKLSDYADVQCSKAIHWYFSKKKLKAHLGIFLRLIAIFAVTGAGIIPVLGEIYDGQFEISPAWATVSLAVAGLFVAFDKFGGHTSAWLRYVQTGLALSHLQEAFRIDRAELQLEEKVLEEGESLVQARIKLCRDFLKAVNDLVRVETEKWAQEFQAALGNLEKDRG